MEKKAVSRIGWIDTARALAIFLIVQVHTTIGIWEVEHFINVFSVPFFFFLSGMTFHARKQRLSFVRKKFLQLYVPYLIVGTISIFVYLLLGSRLGSGQGFNLPDLAANFGSLLYANSSLYSMNWNTPLWFLPALFAALIVFNEICLLKNRWIRLFVVWACTIAGMSLAVLRILLPLQFETVLAMQVWMYAGRQMKNYFSTESIHYSFWLKAFLFILFLVAGFQVGFLNTDISIRDGNYGYNFLLYFLAAWLLICSLIWLAQLIPANRVLSYVGQNTLSILLWHRFAVTFFQSVWSVSATLLLWPGPIIWGRLLWSSFFSVIIIALCLLLAFFWKKLIHSARFYLKKSR